MKQEEFFLAVQKLSNPDDYLRSKNRLFYIPKDFYQAFLNLQKLGGSINSSEKALNEAVAISRNSTITTDDVVILLPKFLKMKYKLDLPI